MLANRSAQSVRAICEAFRAADARRRAALRLLYPGLAPEFNAIEVAEERAERIQRQSQAS